MASRKNRLNSLYGMTAEGQSLARRIADWAIQQNIDSDELRGRMDQLFEPEIIDMVCEIVDDFFAEQGDQVDDLPDDIFTWLTDGKNGNASDLLMKYAEGMEE